MNKFTNKASMLLNLLAFLVFFMLGGLFVKFTGAAEGQGLASGAIVFTYCILFAIVALAGSIFFVHQTNHKSIVNTNRVLAIIFMIILGILTFRFLNLSETNTHIDESPRKVTVPASMFIQPISNTELAGSKQDENEIPIGLGFFKPDFFEKKVMYFYSVPNPKKSIQEHPPFDSISFNKTETGGFEISYAPSWLKPEHMKLDYDILYFKIESLTKDFAEVTVNDVTQKTIFVDRSAGKIIFWPDFLLQVHSIEFKDPGVQKVRVNRFDYAGEVITPFQIMQPILVKDEWLFVELYNDNYDQIGQGWIQWKKNNQLLITYSLLS